MALFLKTMTGKTKQFKVGLRAKVIDIGKRIELTEGVPIDQQRVLYAGQQLSIDRLLADYGIEDGSTLSLVLRLRGGKPVIYLYTPQGETFQNVQVKVTLDSDKWQFDALHPAPLHRTDTECEWLGKKVGLSRYSILSMVFRIFEPIWGLGFHLNLRSSTK